MGATRPRVVIVGGGFGGLFATRELAGAPVSVTLIDKRNYHLFRPMLRGIPTSGLPGGHRRSALGGWALHDRGYEYPRGVKLMPHRNPEGRLRSR